jgi:O-antigen ligase
MMARPINERVFARRENIPFVLIVVFAIGLFFAGGASRADVPAQLIIRSLTWLLLIGAICLTAGFDWRRARAPFALFTAIAGSAALHLLPLPPGIWTSLPGRGAFSDAADLLGLSQPWRPLSISPGATVNAVGSLIVPFLTLILASQLSRSQHRALMIVMLFFICAGCVWGIAQFVDATSSNPLMNNRRGHSGGPFANRNHFALLLSIGLLLLPIWCFQAERASGLRALASVVASALLFLVVLAIGSRAGLILAPLGLLLGLLIVGAPLRAKLATISQSRSLAFLSVGIVTVFGLVAMGVAFDRAATIERLFQLDVGADLRAQALPTLFDMVVHYFPIGTGFGTFDPAFRMSEPDAFLNPSYLNHAHNDFLEVLIDGGLVGGVLLAACVAWWLVRSLRVWRHPTEGAGVLQRAGSAIILLVMAASVTDYPARTPTIMAFLAIAAVWLALADGGEHRLKARAR